MRFFYSPREPWVKPKHQHHSPFMELNYLHSGGSGKHPHRRNAFRFILSTRRIFFIRIRFLLCPRNRTAFANPLHQRSSLLINSPITNSFPLHLFSTFVAEFICSQKQIVAVAAPAECPLIYIFRRYIFIVNA